MNSGKQVMTKPQKKVGGHEGRKEEGKGGEPAVPCRQRLPPGAGAARSAKGVYREVRHSSGSVRHRTAFQKLLNAVS